MFLKELDDFDFQRVSRIHTAKAYKEYLGYHFDGKHVRRARYWWERLKYQEMLESKEPGVLEKFLKGFPEGWFQEVSGVDLQKGEYEALEEKNDVSSYRAFIAKYKNARSEWTEAATQRLERLLLDAARASGDVLRARKIRLRQSLELCISPRRRMLCARRDSNRRCAQRRKWTGKRLYGDSKARKRPLSCRGTWKSKL